MVATLHGAGGQRGGSDEVTATCGLSRPLDCPHRDVSREAHKYLGVHWPWKPALNDFCLNPPNNAANFKALLRLQKSQDNNWSTSEVLLRPRNLSFKRTLGSNSQCILVPAEATAVAAGLATCPGVTEPCCAFVNPNDKDESKSRGAKLAWRRQQHLLPGVCRAPCRSEVLLAVLSSIPPKPEQWLVLCKSCPVWSAKGFVLLTRTFGSHSPWTLFYL